MLRERHYHLHPFTLSGMRFDGDLAKRHRGHDVLSLQREAPDMEIQLTTLPNGLRVVTANLPGFDSAAVAAFVDSGSRNETAGENGIAHFLEHMAFKGTTSRSSLDIAREVENLGSNIN